MDTNNMQNNDIPVREPVVQPQQNVNQPTQNNSGGAVQQQGQQTNADWQAQQPVQNQTVPVTNVNPQYVNSQPYQPYNAAQYNAQNTYAGNQNRPVPPYQPPVIPYYPPNPNPGRAFLKGAQETAKTGKGLGVTLLLILLGMLAFEMLTYGGFGVSVPVLVILFYAIGFWFFRGKKTVFTAEGERLAGEEQAPKKSKVFDLLITIPIILVAVSFFFNYTALSYFVGIITLICVIPAHFARISGYSNAPMFSGRMVVDAFRSSFVNAFGYCDMPFTAIGNASKRKNGKGRFGMALLGIVIAVPVAIIFLIFYYHADEMFRQLVNNVIDKLGVTFWHIVYDIIFGFLLALFLGGWLITAKGTTAPKDMEKPTRKGINGIIVGSFFAVIALVQVLFVAVQFRYLFTGGTALPEGMSYAEYARSGFFELCFTIGISVIIVMVAIFNTSKNEKGRMHPLASVFLSVCILCNYVVVASAIMRMLKYVDAFGLSVKRVGATWLIILLAIGFLGALIKLWLPKFKCMTYVCTCIVIMTALLGFINVNGMVAQYNVDRYINSNYEKTLDWNYLAELGYSASPATAKLLEAKTPSKGQPNKTFALSVLSQQRYHSRNVSWRNTTLPYIQASAVYETYNITEDYSDIYDAYGYNEYGYDSDYKDRNGKYSWQ